MVIAVIGFVFEYIDKTMMNIMIIMGIIILFVGTIPYHIIVHNEEKKIDNLKGLAISNAEHVKDFEESVTLPLMSSYERRIIHMTLADFNGVETESVGEANSRRIIIKPC